MQSISYFPFPSPKGLFVVERKFLQCSLQDGSLERVLTEKADRSEEDVRGRIEGLPVDASG